MAYVTDARQEYHLARYGEALLMEGVGLDAKKYEEIRAVLPVLVQDRLFGWRNTAALPYTEGEVYLPHPLDDAVTVASTESAGGAR